MKISPDNKISVVNLEEQTPAREARRAEKAAKTRAADAVSLGGGAEARFRAVDSAIRETLDGVSLLQVADKAHERLGEAVSRMKDTASRGMDASLSGDERKNLQFELDELGGLVDFISKNTDYSGKSIFGDDKSVTELWAGTIKTLDTSTSYEDSGKITAVAGIGTETLGIENISLLSRDSSADALLRLESAAGRISGNRSQIGAAVSSLGDAARNLAAGAANILSSKTTSTDLDGARSALEYARRSISGSPAASFAVHAAQEREDVLSLAE